MAIDNPYSPPSSDIASVKPIKSYKTVRLVNWFLTILTFPSLFITFISIKEYSALTISVLIIMAIYVGNFLGTAIVINPNVTVFLNIPIILTDGYKKILRTLLLVCNSILALLGVSGVIACFVSSQYPVSIMGFIFLFLGISNLRALWAAKNA